MKQDIMDLTNFLGKRVKFSPSDKTSYEVAEIKKFPHGYMIGIFDEPPSDHVDYINPSRLSIVKKPSKKSAKSVQSVVMKKSNKK